MQIKVKARLKYGASKTKTEIIRKILKREKKKKQRQKERGTLTFLWRVSTVAYLPVRLPMGVYQNL